MNFGCSSSAETMKDKMKTAHNNTTYDKYNTITYTIQDGEPLLLDKLIKDNLTNRNTPISQHNHYKVYKFLIFSYHL